MKFDQARSDAIREMLVATPTRAGSPRAGRVLGSIGLVGLGIVVGAAVSAAALGSHRAGPVSAPPGLISAPRGVLPGQPIVANLGEPTTQTTDGSIEISLPAAPVGATHVRVSITCLTAGETHWGFDPGGNNPSSSCSVDDLGGANSGYFDFPLEAGHGILYIDASDGTLDLVTTQYLNYVETAWGVNERGETYGVERDGKAPDLMAVEGASPSGPTVAGYARSADLNAFGPDWPKQPSSPEQAVKWQAERDARYPNGWDIPVYESDGVTQIGFFHIEN